MKTSIKFIAPALGAAAIGAAMLLAPIASADTNPLVPYGTDPHTPYVLGYDVSHHDRQTGYALLIHQRAQEGHRATIQNSATGRMLYTSIRPVRYAGLRYAPNDLQNQCHSSRQDIHIDMCPGVVAVTSRIPKGRSGFRLSDAGFD